MTRRANKKRGDLSTTAPYPDSAAASLLQGGCEQGTELRIGCRVNIDQCFAAARDRATSRARLDGRRLRGEARPGVERAGRKVAGDAITVDDGERADFRNLPLYEFADVGESVDARRYRSNVLVAADQVVDFGDGGCRCRVARKQRGSPADGSNRVSYITRIGTGIAVIREIRHHTLRGGSIE